MLLHFDESFDSELERKKKNEFIEKCEKIVN